MGAQKIAEGAGLLLCWDKGSKMPSLDESSEEFLQRCNCGATIVKETYKRWCNPVAIENQLSDARVHAATLDEELCAARENVSRAAMQLTATFTTTLKLGAEAATDRMYDLHDWIESDGDSDGADDCELIPVEVAYQAALRHVSRIQKAVAANKARSKLLEEFS